MLAPLLSLCSSQACLLPDYLSRNFYCSPQRPLQLSWNVKDPGRRGGNAEAGTPWPAHQLSGTSWCTLLCGLSGLSSVSVLILPAWFWLDFGLTTSSETLTHSRSGINS